MRERGYRNLVYSCPQGRELKLDLFVPEISRPAPLIVWFHGGGWKYGDKGYRFFVRRLTAEGFAVASVQYRLTKWPAQRDDCLAAVNWLRKNAAVYGLDAGCIGLGGESAGGHLAGLIGTLEGSPKIKAVLAFYPPTDLIALGEYFGQRPRCWIMPFVGGSFVETREDALAASPVTWVNAHDPPFLLVHGDRDWMVPLKQSQILQDKLRRAGVRSRLIVVEGGSHAFLPDRKIRREAVSFFQENLR